MIKHAKTWTIWHTQCKMDLNQDGWASATPKSVANMMKMRQQGTCKHAQMQGTKPKEQSATLPKHDKDEIWHTMTHVPALK